MAIPNPTQFLSFSTLNRIQLPFLFTGPSINANLSLPVAVHSAVFKLFVILMMELIYDKKYPLAFSLNLYSMLSVSNDWGLVTV